MKNRARPGKVTRSLTLRRPDICAYLVRLGQPTKRQSSCNRTIRRTGRRRLSTIKLVANAVVQQNVVDQTQALHAFNSEGVAIAPTPHGT
jgi:hypothetical protein